MNIEQRVQRLEDVDAVKKIIFKAGRWFDRCEMTAKREDVAEFYNTLFTSDGFMEFPFGKWGPDVGEITDELLEFSKNVDWAMHYFMNQEVELNDNLTEAVYHALEIIPVQYENTAMWCFVENESVLKKVDGQWKIYKYGVLDFKMVDSAAASWPVFDKNDKAWMFAKQ